jgi:ketosteroid isomerase-like protein
VRTEETRAVVAGYVAALQRGDAGALRASFTPQATWTIRGDIPVAGTWTGTASSPTATGPSPSGPATPGPATERPTTMTTPWFST